MDKFVRNKMRLVLPWGRVITQTSPHLVTCHRSVVVAGARSPKALIVIIGEIRTGTWLCKNSVSHLIEVGRSLGVKSDFQRLKNFER